MSFWNFVCYSVLNFFKCLWAYFGMFQNLFPSLKCYLFIYEFIQQGHTYYKLCIR